jgi:cardiolipin synthase
LSAPEPIETLPQAQRAELLDRAFTRAAGAALIKDNRVRLLRDAAENYPAWLEAIAAAGQRIHFENYMFCEDEVGAEFAQALMLKARAGVRVRVIYDWMGSLGKASAAYWWRLAEAGVEVRCFNRPRPLAHPLGWLHRDHRKLLTVDGCIGFITGLCIGRMWRGDPAHARAPWRDTGVEIRGPALREIELAFAQVWRATGGSLELQDSTTEPAPATPAGEVALRIVASAPGSTGVFRLDQLIAAAARESLWLTDAYFAGVPPYVQGLCAAAQDGVDVRLLVPGASDIPVLRPLSQAGYRPLLEGGVRVFEWKGSMLHAKTAVADGRWARVGSSNLNIASWIGNYELDAVIENETFALQMEQMFEADLANATEIVLRRRSRRLRAAVARVMHAHGRGPVGVEARGRGGRGGSASRAAAGALRLGRAVGAALTEERVLAPTEARLVAIVGLVLLALAVAAVLWPLVAAIPAAVLLAWIAVALFAKARALHRERRRQGMPATRLEHAGSDPGEESATASAMDQPPSG